MNGVASAAVERFQAEHHRYERVAEEIPLRIKTAASTVGIVCNVTARAKDVQSFRKKIFAKNYQDPWNEVTDKVGARVIVQVAKDVDRLVECLRQEFGAGALLRTEDKRIVTNPAMLGYSGVHVQLITEHTTDEYEQIECEVQLRTAAQDAWSTVSHRVLYKPLLSLPGELQHAIYRLVGLVELFDEEVQRVMDALETLPGTDVLDLLKIADSEFLALEQFSSNKEMSIRVLQAIQGSIDAAERSNYKDLLKAFVESERGKLMGLYHDYGAKSSMSQVSNYILYGQAESLVLLERLNTKPYSLVTHWRSNDFPDEYLEGLANAAGIALPDSN